MEYEKQIEIKLEGNNCIINFPKENNISLQNNSLTNIDDISFSVSVSDEDKNNKNNLYLDNKDNNINTNKNELIKMNNYFENNPSMEFLFLLVMILLVVSKSNPTILHNSVT